MLSLSGVDLSSAKVFLSGNVSPRRVHINIHSSAALFTFCAQLDEHWSIRPFPSMPCASAVQALSTHHEVFDTVILRDGELRILTTSGQHIPVNLSPGLSDVRDELPQQLAARLSMELDRDGPPSHHRTKRITSLIDAYDERVSVRLDDGEPLRLKLDHRLEDSLVRQCLEAIGCILPSQALFTLKQELLSSTQAPNIFRRRDIACIWEAFAQTVRTLLGMPAQRASGTPPLGGISNCAITARLALRASTKRQPDVPPDDLTKNIARFPSPTPGFDSSSASAVLIALHMVGQDCRLAHNRQDDLARTSALILELCAAVGAKDWYDYWMRLTPSSAPKQPVMLSMSSSFSRIMR
jgi:anaphase-promoting complex subunit 1